MGDAVNSRRSYESLRGDDTAIGIYSLMKMHPGPPLLGILVPPRGHRLMVPLVLVLLLVLTASLRRV